ncbi:Galactose oxidase/kelch repeat superfamily protein [Raphanus sativus]|nr:Galactose oxidase/kelch repeat superfamily protein [Raphanus sativus]
MFSKIDNVLYSVSIDGALRWYDTDKTSWRDLKGLVGLPKLLCPFTGYGSHVKLTGYGGGKMMVFWSRDFSIPFSPMETIYCAEIVLERRNGDCWRKLEWYDGVLSVFVGTNLVKVLSVTL